MRRWPRRCGRAATGYSGTPTGRPSCSAAGRTPRRLGLAGVAGAVAVGILLPGVGGVGTVVAGVAPAVVVAVGLGRVGEQRTVGVDVVDGVAVAVESAGRGGDREGTRLACGDGRGGAV